MNKFLILVTLVVLGFVSSSFAQASATAETHATIITPITIDDKIDMNFGNAAVGTIAGTVILSTNNTRTSTGGVVLPSSFPGTVTSAKFETTGLPSATYSITLPTSVTLHKGTNTMIVNNFVSNPVSIGTLGVNGKQDIFVGATLNVTSLQSAGQYEGEFTITANYN